MFVLSIVSSIYIYCLIFHPEVIKEGYQATQISKENVEYDSETESEIDSDSDSETDSETDSEIIQDFELLEHDYEYNKNNSLTVKTK